MKSSERKLQRRTFLKALGLGMSLPLATQFARMAVAQPTRPKRMILYYFPHGVPNEHLDMAPYLDPFGQFKDFGQNPESPIAGTVVTPDYDFTTRSGFSILSPLQPYRSMTHVVRGLYQAGEFGTHDSIAAILTGDGQGPSLDQVVARDLGAKSLFLGAVPRINDNIDGTNGVLVRDEADWIPADGDVVAVHDRLFGGATPAPDQPAPVDEAEFRRRTLDLTIEEVAALRREVAGLSQAESKLSSHLAALENVKNQGSGLGTATGDACGAPPEIPHVSQLRTLDVGKQPWEPPYWRDSTNFERIAEAQAEMAAHAVLCGHAQIVTIQNMWASADIPMPGVLPSRANEPHHLAISHRSYSGNLDDAFRRDFATTQQWFMARVARMCEILDQPDPFDPDHTALENTVIYAFSEIADGDLHGKSLARQWRGGDNDIFQYYPAIVVGGGGGGLAPGKLLTVDNRPIADLLLTLARAMGSPVTAFGGGTGAVFQELLA